MRKLLFTTIFLLGFCVPSVVAAHNFPIERSAVLQVHASHAELLLIYAEPPGPRTDRLLALYDSNRNGEIDGAETSIAEGAMLARANLGLNIQFSKAVHGGDAPRLRFKKERNGGISVAVFQRFEFIAPQDEIAIDVSLQDSVGVPPLELIVEPTDDWKFDDDQTSEKKVTLKPGGAVQFALARVEPRKPEPKRPGEKNWRPSIPRTDIIQ